MEEALRGTVQASGSQIGCGEMKLRRFSSDKTVSME